MGQTAKKLRAGSWKLGARSEEGGMIEQEIRGHRPRLQERILNRTGEL